MGKQNLKEKAICCWCKGTGIRRPEKRLYLDRLAYTILRKADKRPCLWCKGNDNQKGGE